VATNRTQGFLGSHRAGVLTECLLGRFGGRVQCDVAPDLDVPACCRGERGSFVGDVGSLVLQLFSAGGDLGRATLHFGSSMKPPCVQVDEAALLGVAPVLRLWP